MLKLPYAFANFSAPNKPSLYIPSAVLHTHYSFHGKSLYKTFFGNGGQACDDDIWYEVLLWRASPRFIVIWAWVHTTFILDHQVWFNCLIINYWLQKSRLAAHLKRYCSILRHWQLCKMIELGPTYTSTFVYYVYYSKLICIWT